MSGVDDRGGLDEAGRAKARMVGMYDEIAPTYGNVVNLIGVFGRELIAAADLKAGDRVLDVGCGRGACLRPASDAVGPTGFVLGIDISPQMVALLALELEQERVTNAEVRVGDADHLDVAASAFDAVTCGFAVHHFTDLPATLRACRSALRPDGRIAVSTFADGGPDFPWVLDALADTGAFPALRGQTQRQYTTGADELRGALSEAEFEAIVTTTVEKRFTFADPDAHMTWIRGHGLGTIINRLQPEQLRLFVEGCGRRLEQHRTDAGYELVNTVHLTVATRP